MRKNELKQFVAAQAGTVKLPARVRLGQGFQIITSNCLTQMRENQAGVTQARDPESVHQMRVGVRRLRSALGLFARWFPIPEHLSIELDWLADQLGNARDADVLAGGTLPRVMRACPEQAQLLPLLQVALTIADSQRQRAAEAVSSERYSKLTLDLSKWLEQTGQAEPSDDKLPRILQSALKPRATKILARRHKKLLALGQRLADGGAEERHRVRIMAKRVRYATEFFRSLYADKAAKRYVKGLIVLQDGLGMLNDAAVADGLLRQIAQSRPELMADTEFARGMLWGGVGQDSRALAKFWKRFGRIKPPL
jgi:triphosphatase